MSSTYILFCAGEDSGDILGEGLVQSVLRRGVCVKGVGGKRMQMAGLETDIDFEQLPVSGFGDVVPRYFRLRRIYEFLKKMLCSPECVGFVAIDYPGFNMKLCALAKKCGKPVLYVAPPQIWAWKSFRAKKLRDVNLAVLFDFEKKAYARYGCPAKILRHPFSLPFDDLSISEKKMERSFPRKELLLLPGSRIGQASRNLTFYLEIARSWQSEGSHGQVTLLASRISLAEYFEKAVSKHFGGEKPAWLRIELSPALAKDRKNLFSMATAAISAPGTATLELALSAVPLTVVTIPDAMTYMLGSLLVSSRRFAMPNILLHKDAVPEFIIAPWGKEGNISAILQSLMHAKKESAKEIADELEKNLKEGKTPDQLIQCFMG